MKKEFPTQNQGSGGGGDLKPAAVRIQLSRKAGFKLPPNTVVVSRPSKWGNPYRIDTESGSVASCREKAVLKFEAMIRSNPDYQIQVKRELRGKNLACWCPAGPCHANILLEIANS